MSQDKINLPIDAQDEKKHSKAVKKQKEKAKKHDIKKFLEEDEDLVGILSDRDLARMQQD